jgi:hypothetical protein
MKEYLVTGFRYGVWCTISIKTTEECIPMRAREKGMTDISYYEEVAHA